jgi:hypothetical protein
MRRVAPPCRDQFDVAACQMPADDRQQAAVAQMVLAATTADRMAIVLHRSTQTVFFRKRILR